MVTEIGDFQREVIEASHQSPVVVDFWAPWCGPCRMLGPVLERLADDAGGKWRLAKLNTDENPDVSARFGIRSIPAVKMFVDGEVVDEFIGALPEPQVRQWLSNSLPGPNRALLGQAEAFLLQNDQAAAEMTLRQALDIDPQDAKARCLLASLVVFSKPEEARELLSDVHILDEPYFTTRQAVHTLLRAFEQSHDDSGPPESPVKGMYLTTVKALQRADFDSAMPALIDVLRRDRHYADDAARKLGVAVFAILGPKHAVTQKYRRTFDMTLF